MNFVAIPSIATCFVVILGIATVVNPSKNDANTPGALYDLIVTFQYSGNIVWSKFIFDNLYSI